VNDDFHLGDWLFQPSLHRLSRGTESVHLEPKTIEVLLCLTQRAGEVVTKQEILETVWPDTFVEEVALARCVSELRKILGDNPKAPAFIETIPKRGYRLLAAVSGGSHPVIPRSHVSRLALAIVALVLLAAAVGTYRLQRPKPAPRNAATIGTVAVLPLRSLPGQPNEDYIVDGMTQMIITSLTRLGPRKVISYGSTLHYKDSKKPLSQIAQELDVDALVEGTILRRGDRARVNVELIDAQTGRNVWAGSYERPAQDLFNLQADVARAIAIAIEPALSHRSNNLLARGGVSEQAYEAYLRGWHHLNRSTSEPAVREAIVQFQSAIAAEPRYADAYAALAVAYFSLSELWMPPREAMPKAKAAATKALEIDEQLASAHTSVALVEAYYEWNWQAAGNEFRRAVELNPSDPAAHEEYGRFLGLMGDGSEAVSQVEIARELDPLSLSVNRTLGIVYNQAGRYDDAIRQMKHRLAMDASPGAGRFHLGNAYAKKGMFDEALAQFDLILPHDSPHRIAALGGLYVQMGRKADAETMLAQLKEMKKHRWVSSYSIAGIESALGHRHNAIHSLQLAYDERDEGLMKLRVDRGFDSLRPEPEFRRLMAQVFPSAPH
jgi:TolB-like protein/DNA-binding winged helix-turn-helix (wHTH) protein